MMEDSEELYVSTRRMLWGVDYFVRYLPLPYHVGGATTLNNDGTYNIYLNSRHYADRQWKALLHELGHCVRGHLEDRRDIPDELKEWEADHTVIAFTLTEDCG
jgi:hypothetical protein